MKYTIMHINDRAKENIEKNKKILSDYEYVDSIDFFNGMQDDGPNTLKSMNINIDAWNPYDGRKFAPMPGEYGVWISTLRFLNYMIDNDVEKMLLLEDDVVVMNSFISNLKKCLKEIPENFDFLSLYYNNGHNHIDDSTEIGKKYIHKSNNQYSAGLATVYSLSGAKKIMKLIKRKGLEYTSDCFIFKQAQLGSLNGYSIKPEQIVFVKLAENIESTIDPHNFRET